MLSRLSIKSLFSKLRNCNTKCKTKWPDFKLQQLGEMPCNEQRNLSATFNFLDQLAKIKSTFPLLTILLRDKLTLPMLRLLSSKAQGHKHFSKPSKPSHVGIHWITLTEFFQMSTYMAGFLSYFRFFASFCIGQISHQQHKGQWEWHNHSSYRSQTDKNWVSC